jgi:N-acetyl-anhydromuramyl-L-alanine amidase AmpD/uncharacterized protein YdeI (BOF family)
MMNVQIKSALVMCVVLASCGLDSTPTAPQFAASNSAGTFEKYFAQAAQRYQVPVEVLKSIAWVETRASDAPTISAMGGFGVMQLSSRNGFDTLAEAAKLTGVSVGELKVNPKANINGAAAVLRKQFDAQSANNASLNANEIGDWFQAVSMYPGIDSATLANGYAADVFVTLEKGFESQTVSQSPKTSEWKRNAPVSNVRKDALIEYPAAAAWVASPNFSSGRSSYEFVLIHTMQGSYAGSRSWFLNPNSNVSSHYIVRSSDGEITQMVAHANTAWHAQCYNGRSIGIEHEGFVGAPDMWYTTNMYTESAKLTRWIADRHGIPKNRTHIIGHFEVAPNCNTGGHTDPGSGWNWTRYMQLVGGTTPTPTTGVLIGAIYTGGAATNRVAGATVTVNGQTVTTAADGLFQFTLNPGSYTATVTKAGFSTNTVMRTVIASTQTWGSMEINPSAATGTLRGVVYAFNAANPSDLSSVIANAAVTVNGQTVMSGTDGAYLFNIAPGTYTVSVTKAGYQNNSLSRTVTASTITWGSVGLLATQMADTQAPDIAFSFPVDASMNDLAIIEVKGTASDNVALVGGVMLSINSGMPTEVPVANGIFSTQIILKPGTNTLKMTAKDAANNMGSATITTTFRAGVAGVVSVADSTTKLEGVRLKLLDMAGTEVSTAVTNVNGEYALGVMNVAQDYKLVAQKMGYIEVLETVTVPAENRVTLNVAMVAGIELPAQVTLKFTEPVDGAEVTTDTVTVYGQLEGFDATNVKVNGVLADQLGAGGFSATVPLVEGANVIEAIASGLNNKTASGRISVTRKAASPPPGMSLAPVRGGCGCNGLGEWPLLGVLIVLVLRRRW